MTERSKPGPERTVTDDELLALFQKTSDPVLSTAEVANQVSLSRRSVYNRLVALREQGRIESKNIGGRNTVWWVSES
jgi:biotin operon repressor